MSQTDEITLEKLKASSAEKESVLFSANSMNAAFQTHIVSIQENNLIIANTIPAEQISQIVKSSKFFVQLDMIRCVSEEIHSDGVNIVFPLDRLRVLEDNRGSPRRMLKEKEKAVVRFINPIDKVTVLEKPILDISATGLSFSNQQQSLLYSKGREIDALDVILGNKKTHYEKASIIYNRTLFDEAGKSHVQVGLQFFNFEN